MGTTPGTTAQKAQRGPAFKGQLSFPWLSGGGAMGPQSLEPGLLPPRHLLPSPEETARPAVASPFFLLPLSHTVRKKGGQVPACPRLLRPPGLPVPVPITTSCFCNTSQATEPHKGPLALEWSAPGSLPAALCTLTLTPTTSCDPGTLQSHSRS